MDVVRIYIAIITILIMTLYLLKNFTVVKFDEIHVIQGKRMRIYDGGGSYIFFPYLMTRKILSKAVITIDTNISVSDTLNNPVSLQYHGRILVTKVKIAAERLLETKEENIKIQAEEVINLSLKSTMRKISVEELNKNLIKISDEIFEVSKNELDKIGLELSQFFIQLK